MHLPILYRQFAADCRSLAATLTEPADKRALEVFAIAWDKIAENREAILRSNLNQSTSATSPATALARSLNIGVD